METLRPLAPLIVAVLFCALIAACATPEQIAERKAMQEQADIRTCIDYGLKPGSEAFGNCRLQIDLERERRTYPSYYGGARYGHGHFHPHFSYGHWF